MPGSAPEAATAWRSGPRPTRLGSPARSCRGRSRPGRARARASGSRSCGRGRREPRGRSARFRCWSRSPSAAPRRDPWRGRRRRSRRGSRPARRTTPATLKGNVSDCFDKAGSSAAAACPGRSRSGRQVTVEHPHHLRRDPVRDQAGDEGAGAGAHVDVELVDGAVGGQQVDRAQGADLIHPAREPAAAQDQRRLGGAGAHGGAESPCDSFRLPRYRRPFPSRREGLFQAVQPYRPSPPPTIATLPRMPSARLMLATAAGLTTAPAAFAATLGPDQPAVTPAASRAPSWPRGPISRAVSSATSSQRRSRTTGPPAGPGSSTRRRR